MHELGIAQTIVDSVLLEQERRRLPRITEIGVRVGALSGVLPDALAFSFEVIVRDTPLDMCRLRIECIPVEGRCGACGDAFAVEDLVFACPRCRSGKITLKRGYELDIAYLECVDEPPGRQESTELAAHQSGLERKERRTAYESKN